MTALYETLSSAINLVGLLATACFLYDNFKSLFSILKAVLEPYFRPELPHSLLDRFGKWAVITGGSAGIGKGYAKELAKRGLNVVIISHMKEELIATANEIENLYQTKVKWILADFSKGKEAYQHIKQELLGIPIGILVNNVGCAYCPDELCTQSEDWLWNIINLNVGAVTLMSRIVIPQMKKQGKGAIVNIASSAHWIPTPLVAVYGATKRYVRSLSLAMERELFKYNINVQCVEPWFVRTELIQFSDILSRNKYFGTPVDTFTRSAVFILGKTLETTGYWTHAIMIYTVNPQLITATARKVISLNRVESSKTPKATIETTEPKPKTGIIARIPTTRSAHIPPNTKETTIDGAGKDNGNSYTNNINNRRLDLHHRPKQGQFNKLASPSPTSLISANSFYVAANQADKWLPLDEDDPNINRLQHRYRAAVLESYFRPQLPHTLPEKFGKWAENLYKTEVKWIVADFSKGKEVYEHIKQELLGIPIGILVNNVGCASYPDELCNRSEDWLWNIIYLNVGAVTLMSRIVIPQMKKQGKGAIVNIASSAHWIPTPSLAVYAATKRYVRSLSLAMERELFKYNITVQCVEPWFVRTELTRFSETLSRGTFFGTPVEAFTRSAVFTLGKTKETTGYWAHGIMVKLQFVFYIIIYKLKKGKFQSFFLKLAPEWLRIRISHAFINHIRKEWLNNQFKEKEK
uniref:Uncharacterized protein n=1 Tax=Glossina palpalis gambiensis TaxID=67801 RepID=A0A1B0AUP4_9MUSC